MVIPYWLKKYISEDEIKHLEQKIAQIESQCDVEIVPVIVRSSSQYAQTKITLALVFMIFFLELWYMLDIQWYWDGSWSVALFFTSLLLTLFGIAPALAKNGRVQMLMTHRHVEEEQCWKRAQTEFYSGRVSRTKRDNGILIYVSMLEHRVIVKADTSISAKVDDSLWQESVQKIILGMKTKKMALGLGEALDKMVILLKTQFPLTAQKANELANTFIIKE